MRTQPLGFDTLNNRLFSGFFIFLQYTERILQHSFDGLGERWTGTKIGPVWTVLLGMEVLSRR